MENEGGTSAFPRSASEPPMSVIRAMGSRNGNACGAPCPATGDRSVPSEAKLDNNVGNYEHSDV